MSDAKRKEIKIKINAAEARNEARAEPNASDRAGEKAIEMKDKLAAFAREHPVATVAGGLALGILVSSLFRRSPTRKAGRALGRKTAGLAAIAAELAIAYAQQAYAATADGRRARSGKLGQWGDSLTETAKGLSEDAADYAAGAAAAARKAGRSAAKSLRGRLH